MCYHLDGMMNVTQMDVDRNCDCIKIIKLKQTVVMVLFLDNIQLYL